MFVATDRGVWRWHDGQFTELVIPGAKWTTHGSLVVRTGRKNLAVAPRTLYRLHGDEPRWSGSSRRRSTRWPCPRMAILGASRRRGSHVFNPASSDGHGNQGRAGHGLSPGLGRGLVVASRKGLHRLRDGQATAITTADGLGAIASMALMEDRESSVGGNRWRGIQPVAPEATHDLQRRERREPHGCRLHRRRSPGPDVAGNVWGGLCVGSRDSGVRSLLREFWCPMIQ